MLPEVRAARIVEAIGRYGSGRLSCLEAAEVFFGTLQNRLPQELRLAGISDIEAANRYIREVFLPAFNAQFAVPAAEPGSAFVAYLGPELTDILSIQEARQVQNDNTVRYHGLLLQIPEQSHRRHFVKASEQTHQQQPFSQNYRSCSGPPWTL